jgi:hypothetical protein
MYGLSAHLRFGDSATIPVDEDDFKDSFNTYKEL